MADSLSQLLGTLRLRARILYVGGVCGPWRLDTSGSGLATFHLVARGQAWLSAGMFPEPVAIAAGDLVLFPRDATHAITAQATGCEVVPKDQFAATGAGDADVLCGAIELVEGQGHPVLAALPDAVVIRAAQAQASTRHIAEILREESLQSSAGRDVLVTRLAEALFVLAARECLGRPDARGVLAGIAEPRLHRALSALHAEPQRAWTLEMLARTAGMSRTAFAAEFQRRLGTTAMNYLLHWRMRRAGELILEEAGPMEEVAHQVGYQSAASFIRAFTRVHGVTPGKFARRSARRQASG